MNDVKCSAKEAVWRARSMVNNGGQYVYGTGDYHPASPTAQLPHLAELSGTVGHDTDLPWTNNQWGVGSDCAGFAISWCWKLKRHRPGFNLGIWSSVSDDINCNSALEDSQHAQELFVPVLEDPQPGDLLLYPTFHFGGKEFIGHVCIIETVPAGWKGGFHWMTVIQCHGPNGFKPGVVGTDGSIWDHHDSIWPLPQHRSHIIRPRERL